MDNLGRRLAMTLAEGVDTVCCVHENGERDGGDEAHESVEAEAGSRQDENELLLVKSRHESPVVFELEVLEATTHEVHRALGEQRLETLDLVEAGE